MKQLVEAPETPALFTASPASGGLFLSSATEAMLLDSKTGKTIWSLPLPARGLGLPLATPLELPAFSDWGAHTILLLDPKSGKEAARFEQPAYTELVQADDLGLRLLEGPSFDPQGNPRALTGTPAFVLERSTEPKRLRAGSGAPLVEVTTDLAIVAERRTETEDQIALFVWPNELVIARRLRN